MDGCRDHFGKVLEPGDAVRYHGRDGRSPLATVVAKAGNGSCVLRLDRPDERELFEVDGADLTYISRTIAKKSLKLQTGYVN